MARQSLVLISFSTSHIQIDPKKKDQKANSDDSSSVAHTTLGFGPEELGGGSPSSFTNLPDMLQQGPIWHPDPGWFQVAA